MNGRIVNATCEEDRSPHIVTVRKRRGAWIVNAETEDMMIEARKREDATYEEDRSLYIHCMKGKKSSAVHE